MAAGSTGASFFFFAFWAPFTSGGRVDEDWRGWGAGGAGPDGGGFGVRGVGSDWVGFAPFMGRAGEGANVVAGDLCGRGMQGTQKLSR